MTITLPIPNRKLSPNARVHWRVRSKLTKEARSAAQFATMDAESADGVDNKDFNAYRLTFYWPDLRQRDDDNAAASCKAYRDGIADALRVDDKTLRFHGPPAMLLDRANPRLEIELFLHS